MEIVPGIHQLKVPIPGNPLGHLNAYLAQGDNGWLLVDTGWNVPEAFDALEKQVGEVGIGFEDITQIVVTHFHPDHYGLAGRIKQLSGAKLALHQVEKDLIESRYIHPKGLLAEMAEWLRLNGVPEAEVPTLQKVSFNVRDFVLPSLPEITLHGGDRISTGRFNFEVIWTPGHSPGHICLYEPKRKLLLSGDHILLNITPNIGLHPQSGDNPLGDYLDSLTALKQLDVELVLPAHEDVFSNFEARIEQLLEHHEKRKSDALDALEQGAKTGYQTAAKIQWILNDAIVPFEELSPLDKRLATMETLAHLELLFTEGKVDKVRRDVILYSPL